MGRSFGRRRGAGHAARAVLLVFVFAITQVTGFLAANESGEGLLRGALLLAALWWAWGTYAWLTNTVDPEEGAVRLAVFAAAAAMLVVALATPAVFGAEAVVFGIAYFLVRACTSSCSRSPPATIRSSAAPSSDGRPAPSSGCHCW